MLQQLTSYQAQIFYLQNLCSSPFIGSYTNHSGVESNLAEELLKMITHTKYFLYLGLRLNDRE